MAIVAPDNRRLEREAAEAKTATVSPLQTYATRRFEGAYKLDWLSGQKIDQAVKACEMLGACLEYGAHCNLNLLSMDDWDRAGAAGFEAASKGPAGIHEALQRIQRHSHAEGRQGTPQATFGRLYQWLQFNRSARHPGPIRGVIREFILDTMAIEPGTKLFDEVIKTRRRHSISSLSDATGLHPRTLNRALVRTGEIPDADENRVDCGVSVDASVGETLAKRIINSIPISQIPTYLNCNRTQAEMLVRRGILHKLVPELGRRGGVLTNVALEDIDNLLARMRSVGQPVNKASPGMMNAIEASEVARWPVVDIVRLILDGDLSRVQLLAESLGFRSVLIDPNEVKRAMFDREAELGLSAAEVAESLGIFSSGVMHLRTNKDRDGRLFLRPIETKNARGTIHYRFPPSEVARFAEAHAKLRVLARENGLSSKTLKKNLDSKGIFPILPRNFLNESYYRRADLEL